MRPLELIFDCARDGIGERLAVAAAEQVAAGPRAHAQRAGGEHRRDGRLHQRLARLAVAAAERDVVRLGERLERGQARAGGRREVDERAALLDRGERVERARREHAEAAVERARQRVRVRVRRVRLGRRLGRAEVEHDDAVELLALAERAQVGGDARDRGARLGARLAVGDAGAHLGLGGGELRRDGLGHARAGSRRRRRAARRGRRAASRRRRGRRRRGRRAPGRPASANGGRHRDDAGGGREPGRDRGRAGDRGGGDRAAAADQPRAGPAGLHCIGSSLSTPGADFRPPVNQSHPT